MASGGAAGGAGRRALHSARAEDVASASSFRDFEALHLHLDLRAEFASRTLSGSAVLDLRCLAPAGAAELRLDSHPSLEVTAAALRRGPPGPGEPPGPEEPVGFRTRPFARYGCALCLSLPQPLPAGERFQVLLTYRVGDAGPAVSAQVAPGCPRSGRGGEARSRLFLQAGRPGSFPRRLPGSCGDPSRLPLPGPARLVPFLRRKAPCPVRFLLRTRALPRRNCRSQGAGPRVPSQGPLGFCFRGAGGPARC